MCIRDRLIGFFAKNGKLIAVIKINIICKTEDIRTLLVNLTYLSLYGSEISATLVKPDPDKRPIISRTRP